MGGWRHIGADHQQCFRKKTNKSSNDIQVFHHNFHINTNTQRRTRYRPTHRHPHLVSRTSPPSLLHHHTNPTYMLVVIPKCLSLPFQRALLAYHNRVYPPHTLYCCWCSCWWCSLKSLALLICSNTSPINHVRFLLRLKRRRTRWQRHATAAKKVGGEIATFPTPLVVVVSAGCRLGERCRGDDHVLLSTS